LSGGNRWEHAIGFNCFRSSSTSETNVIFHARAPKDNRKVKVFLYRSL
jgi:hypothetical protein